MSEKKKRTITITILGEIDEVRFSELFSELCATCSEDSEGESWTEDGIMINDDDTWETL